MTNIKNMLRKKDWHQEQTEEAQAHLIEAREARREYQARAARLKNELKHNGFAEKMDIALFGGTPR